MACSVADRPVLCICSIELHIYSESEQRPGSVGFMRILTKCI